MITILKDKKLARKLKNGEVSEKEGLAYVVLNGFFYFLLVTDYFKTNETLDYYKSIYFVFFDITLFILMPFFCFYINQRGDNKDFIKRYVCLSLPVGLLTLLISFIPIHVAYFFENYDYILSYMSLTAKMPTNEIPLFYMPEIGLWSLGVLILTYIFVGWRYWVTFQIASGMKE